MPNLKKQKSYDWKDSNVALLGTDKDRGVKSKRFPSNSYLFFSMPMIFGFNSIPNVR